MPSPGTVIEQVVHVGDVSGILIGNYHDMQVKVHNGLQQTEARGQCGFSNLHGGPAASGWTFITLNARMTAKSSGTVHE